MTMLSQSAATIRSKCHYIKHPDMLALLLCTSERCTWTGHICCGCSSHQSQGLSIPSDEVVIDELGCATNIADDVL